MFEFIMQGTFVDSIVGLLVAIMVAFGVISTFAIFWAKKAKAIALAKGNTKLAELADKIISVLEDGQKIAVATQNQEVKIKQFGEILYQFMGPKADEIRDKYQVRIDQLTKDVQDAQKTVEERQKSLEQLAALYEQIQAEIPKP